MWQAALCFGDNSVIVATYERTDAITIQYTISVTQ